MKPKFQFSLLSGLAFITILSISFPILYWLGATERAIRADLGLLPSTMFEIVTPVVHDEVQNRESVWILVHEDDGYDLRLLYRGLGRHSRWESPEDRYRHYYVPPSMANRLQHSGRIYSQRFPVRPSRERIESMINYLNGNH